MQSPATVTVRPLPGSRLRLTLPNRRSVALVLAVALAVVWWLVASYIRSLNVAPVWYDQSVNFALARPLADPYAVTSFVNPPWALLLLAPFSRLPLELAVLAQSGLYFALLTLVIYKFGGNITTVLVTLTSFVALDAVIELNIEWLIVLGLLLPVPLSGPLLVIKPQIALGYYLSVPRRDLIRAGIVLLSVVLASLLIWGNWPLALVDNLRISTLSNPIRAFNLSPWRFLSAPVSVAIGIGLSLWAFRRRDAPLSILAWLFFVPYITLYSLLPALAMLALRLPRVALIINVVMWLVYGRVLLLAVSG